MARRAAADNSKPLDVMVESVLGTLQSSPALPWPVAGPASSREGLPGRRPSRRRAVPCGLGALPGIPELHESVEEGCAIDGRPSHIWVVPKEVVLLVRTHEVRAISFL